jgi:hypothetical protein
VIATCFTQSRGVIPNCNDVEAVRLALSKTILRQCAKRRRQSDP